MVFTETFTSAEWVQKYLERIDYREDISVSYHTLCALQEAHLHAVPYENFDILNGVPLSLEIPDLLDKIVARRRGGYCFELNRLFGWLLRQLGFETIDLFGRYVKGEPEIPMRRHQVLKVILDRKSYLCDVGVGAIIPLHPMLLEENLVQPQANGNWMMTKDDFLGWILNEQKADGSFERIYAFTEEPQLPVDFKTTSYFCEHSPESVFRKGVMAALRVGNGRNTIDGEEFRVFDGKTLVSSFVPKTQEEFESALYAHLGIRL